MLDRVKVAGVLPNLTSLTPMRRDPVMGTYEPAVPVDDVTAALGAPHVHLPTFFRFH